MLIKIDTHECLLCFQKNRKAEDLNEAEKKIHINIDVRNTRFIIRHEMHGASALEIYHAETPFVSIL